MRPCWIPLAALAAAAVLMPPVAPAARGAAAPTAPKTASAAAASVAPDREAAEVRTVAKAFMAALLDGDADRARRNAHVTRSEIPLLTAMALNLGGDARLAAAIERRFGASEAANAAARVADLLDRSPVAVHGGAVAELGRPGGETLPVRKVAGRWKVDVAELAARRGTADVLPLAEARAAAVRRTIAEVDAGRYVTADQARAARQERYAAVRRDFEEQAQASTAE